MESMTSGTTPNTASAERATTQAPAALVERDAARYIAYSQSYLRKQRRLGGGPPYSRNRRSIRYRIADLDAWLTAHRVSHTA